MEIFRALLSNQEPSLSPPDESDDVNVFDFWRLLISIIVAELCIMVFLWLLTKDPLLLLPSLHPLLVTMISGLIWWVRLWIPAICEPDKTSTPFVPRVVLTPLCFKLFSYMVLLPLTIELLLPLLRSCRNMWKLLSRLLELSFITFAEEMCWFLDVQRITDNDVQSFTHTTHKKQN